MTKKKSKRKVNTSEDTATGPQIDKGYITIGDASLLIDGQGDSQLFVTNSLPENPKSYTIQKHVVEKIEFTPDKNLFVFTTKKGSYFRDHKNKELEGSKDWADYYLEEETGDFFRKDHRGKWYDVHGYLLKTSFLIKDQVLFSLEGKSSRKSLFYRDQILFTTPKSTMVQVGKVVYDIHLNVLNYFGEKITGLGPTNIIFEGNQSIQEVRLGLTKVGFINEETYKPFLINGEEVTSHITTKKVGNYTFELFKSKQSQFVICNHIENVLTYDDEILTIDLDTYRHIGKRHLIKTTSRNRSFYFDLESAGPYTPNGDQNLITEIESNPVEIGKHLLFNMKGSKGKFVLDGSNHTVFNLANENILPEHIQLIPEFESYFFQAVINGVPKVCNVKTKDILTIGDQAIECSEIIGKPKEKLLNVVASNGINYALDARFGLDQIQFAKVGNFRIVRSLGSPFQLGNEIVQNVLLETLGGSKRRVINLNHEKMSVACLPNDLLAYAEQSETSAFAGNELVEVDYENPVHIDDKSFFKAKFIDFINEEKSVILQVENGRPLQLDGVGHRNELVTSFDSDTLSKKYYLSDHRMIGVNSLTEDLKKNQLLFSLKTMSSWLPFYESYLPILKKINDIEENKGWEYHLFELHNIYQEKEYIAIEQNPPFRILADKKKSKYRPRIVKSKEIVLKSPEEISAIRRFFSNPGYLVEVG